MGVLAIAREKWKKEIKQRPNKIKVTAKEKKEQEIVSDNKIENKTESVDVIASERKSKKKIKKRTK